VKHSNDPDAQPWAGAYRSYDLVKEFVIALVVVSLLTVALATLFSSPDEKQVTLQQWANDSTADFVKTAAMELDATSGTATYGAPYNKTPDAAQKIGPVSLQHIVGVTIPVDTVNEFVVTPLRAIADDPTIVTALAAWDGAAADQRQTWAAAYETALTAVDGDTTKVATGDYGPVPVMLAALVTLARSGGLEGALLAQGNFYQTDYTRPLLFLADGAFIEDKAVAQHLGGDQWGMMNETGNYPGQPWLWLFTFWYQVKPFSTSDNADALVWALMMVLTAGLVFLPFIPGLRSLPKVVPVYRLIWKDYYRSVEGAVERE
jgi:hypothetical protein